MQRTEERVRRGTSVLFDCSMKDIDGVNRIVEGHTTKVNGLLSKLEV